MSDSALADEFSEVIRQADEAMFVAKQSGRARIVLAASAN
jgi:PleD family two-component response regulator